MGLQFEGGRNPNGIEENVAHDSLANAVQVALARRAAGAKVTKV
jgi:hypothetical protein